MLADLNNFWSPLQQRRKQERHKNVSMVRKYHTHTLQTNPRHREEESQNNNSHKTLGRQTKLSNQFSLSHQDDCQTRKDTKHCTAKHGTNTEAEPQQWEKNKQRIKNNRTTSSLVQSNKQPFVYHYMFNFQLVAQHLA